MRVKTSENPDLEQFNTVLKELPRLSVFANITASESKIIFEKPEMVKEERRSMKGVSRKQRRLLNQQNSKATT